MNRTEYRTPFESLSLSADKTFNLQIRFHFPPKQQFQDKIPNSNFHGASLQKCFDNNKSDGGPKQNTFWGKNRLLYGIKQWLEATKKSEVNTSIPLEKYHFPEFGARILDFVILEIY